MPMAKHTPNWINSLFQLLILVVPFTPPSIAIAITTALKNGEEEAAATGTEIFEGSALQLTTVVVVARELRICGDMVLLRVAMSIMASHTPPWPASAHAPTPRMPVPVKIWTTLAISICFLRTL